MESAHTVWATLGLPLHMACVLSWSALLRFQVAQQQNYLRWVLGCVHFPDLHCSGSGSQVSHKLMESHISLVGGVGWAASLPGCLSTVREPGSKDTQHHVEGMLVRLPCYSKCGFRTSSISWKTVRNTEPQALPDHLNQNPTLNNIHRCFLCTFEFESHCLRRWLDPNS